MNLAVKFYSQVDNPSSIPGEWPALVVELGDGTTLPDDSWTLMNTESYAAYLADHEASKEAWNAANLSV